MNCHVPVLIPEDIIGLKVQSMVNDPARRSLDMADIEYLLQGQLSDLNLEMIRAGSISICFSRGKSWRRSCGGSKMLSAKEKKEMRADGLSRRRRREFAEAQKEKPGISRTLNAYMAFLMDVQKVRPLGHKCATAGVDKNIL